MTEFVGAALPAWKRSTALPMTVAWATWSTWPSEGSIFHTCSDMSLTVAASAGFSALGPFYSLLSSFLRGTAAAGGIAFVNAVGTGLGGFIGPVVVGVLKQQTGGYASGMAALATGLVLSAALVLLMERLKRPAVSV